MGDANPGYSRMAVRHADDRPSTAVSATHSGPHVDQKGACTVRTIDELGSTQPWPSSRCQTCRGERTSRQERSLMVLLADKSQYDQTRLRELSTSYGRTVHGQRGRVSGTPFRTSALTSW